MIERLLHLEQRSLGLTTRTSRSSGRASALMAA
jgi:hypothetical protein